MERVIIIPALNPDERLKEIINTNWDLENLVITPHSSGFYHLPATLGRVVDICAKNLSAYLNGGELINVVDFKTGYKK